MVVLPFRFCLSLRTAQVMFHESWLFHESCGQLFYPYVMCFMLVSQMFFNVNLKCLYVFTTGHKDAVFGEVFFTFSFGEKFQAELFRSSGLEAVNLPISFLWEERRGVGLYRSIP